jgi:hypothetical protein
MMVSLLAAIPNPGGAASPGKEKWLRITGSEAEGYSLTAHLEPSERPLYDYWFATLDEAFAAGRDYEIEREPWRADEPGSASE